MEEGSTCTPYRENAIALSGPLDPALVPDCGYEFLRKFERSDRRWLTSIISFANVYSFIFWTVVWALISIVWLDVPKAGITVLIVMTAVCYWIQWRADTTSKKDWLQRKAIFPGPWQCEAHARIEGKLRSVITGWNVLRERQSARETPSVMMRFELNQQRERILADIQALKDDRDLILRWRQGKELPPGAMLRDGPLRIG